MDALDLARWQFAITTVYHFLFVPITIGMSALVAGFHTAWVRSHNPQMYKLTKFFGKLFVINFALGLVTGIVQEFQFGMNWSDYSRFVGDIFGAPLAFEALLTFFLESTFLGLWIFGWGRIPEKLHAMTMWLVHIGTVMSAFFILAANSFMQNPVGYRFNEATNRAELTDFVAVLTNKVQLVTFPHVIFAAYMTGGAMVLAVALWHLRRPDVGDNAPMYRKATRVGAVVTLVASLGVMISGDLQGKVMTEVQPMKMAAAEALYENTSHAPFSVLSVGALDGSKATHIIEIPGLLSFLGHGDFNAEVKGINPLQREAAQKFSDGKFTQSKMQMYTPNIPGTYWTFRLMMGLGFLGTFISLLVLWVTRKKEAEQQLARKWWLWAAIILPFTPVFANSFGWIFTEIGRQPWIVHELMTVENAVSPRVTAVEVLISMVVYTVLYAALAVVEIKLFLKYVRMGAEAIPDPGQKSDREDDDAPLAYAY
ncbi:cytochrome bd-I ubiquinol oxidase subunit 1 apoprotein [Austwickia chelonae]|uniref:Cytochrome bd-I oxidase subunit I n=1 Tax=Austwickia chelonae NBRC 105200 TaxID=1184607 RepID=K6VPI2_9MICO|nr:cytochrome ubiquinol oxidase subunit I [Austwickia chelonae]GAB78634.1 cytochrome bd-I oxidase subunit I [Austwickia chelonae NBRC 105200]SEW34270.1 cytochrome bd-I ubiquinol oxidase subunit 1 apoprotein [Austwickia chelonae]